MEEIQLLKDKAHKTDIVLINNTDTEQQQKKDQTRNKTLAALIAVPKAAPDKQLIDKKHNLTSETYAKAFIRLLSSETPSPTLAYEMIKGIGIKALANHLHVHTGAKVTAIESQLKILTDKEEYLRGLQPFVQVSKGKQGTIYQRQFNQKVLEELKAILTGKNSAVSDNKSESSMQKGVRDIDPSDILSRIGELDSQKPEDNGAGDVPPGEIKDPALNGEVDSDSEGD